MLKMTEKKTQTKQKKTKGKSRSFKIWKQLFVIAKMEQKGLSQTKHPKFSIYSKSLQKKIIQF